jgi:transcriptional regulator with XRE-family HTH domain
MSVSLAKTFGKKLKHYRERLDIDQKAMAEKLGVVKSFVSMLEAGERAPSLETVEHAARILKVDPLKLLGA